MASIYQNTLSVRCQRWRLSLLGLVTVGVGMYDIKKNFLFFSLYPHLDCGDLEPPTTHARPTTHDPRPTPHGFDGRSGGPCFDGAIVRLRRHVVMGDFGGSGIMSVDELRSELTRTKHLH